MTFLGLIETYQSALATLIVGVLGFWGVIYTMRHNRNLADAERRAVLAHEISALRAGLRQEMVGIIDTQRRNLESNLPEQNILVPLHFYDGFFRASIAKLGTLTPGELQAVLTAYTQYAAMNYSLPAFGEIKTPGFVEISGKWSAVVRKSEADLQARFEAAVASVDAATAGQTQDNPALNH